MELRALGADVCVFEKRGAFTRINRLKLWEWVKFDLLGWGARQILPKFGVGAGHLHIGIHQLQLLLWKVCLLLGVDLRLGTEICEEDDGGLQTRSAGQRCSSSGSEREAVNEPVQCDVLIEAGGPGGIAWPRADFAFDVVRMAEAIGLVANFERKAGVAEDFKEFSWARQFNQELFARLEQKTGANLENIVYFRGEEAHYFVMTPRRKALVAAGVLEAMESSTIRGAESPTPSGSEALRADAVALRAHVRAIANFFGLPEECGIAAEPQLFDFSSRRSCRTAMRRSPTPASGAEACRQPLLVALVGDALLEPFWPEGLGITRGFLGALDTVWELSALSAADFNAARATAESSVAGGPLEAACRSREVTWKILRQLGAANQAQYMFSEDRSYSLDPRTRYKHHLLS